MGGVGVSDRTYACAAESSAVLDAKGRMAIEVAYRRIMAGSIEDTRSIESLCVGRCVSEYQHRLPP